MIRRRIIGTRRRYPRIPKPFPLQEPAFHPDGRVTLFLPIPHRILSPNARRGGSHGAAMLKYNATLAHRKAGFLAMVDALARRACLGPFRGYSLAFFFKTTAFRDDDNADASCKTYRDGIAEALRIDDRDFRKVELSTHAKDAVRPRVEITLHPIQ